VVVALPAIDAAADGVTSPLWAQTQLLLRSEARVVLTVRSGEPAPDAITGLWKDGLLPRWSCGH
jgi:hypothetical protein